MFYPEDFVKKNSSQKDNRTIHMVVGIKDFSLSSFFIKLQTHFVGYPSVMERTWNLGSNVHTWVWILVLHHLPVSEWLVSVYTILGLDLITYHIELAIPVLKVLPYKTDCIGNTSDVCSTVGLTITKILYLLFLLKIKPQIACHMSIHNVCMLHMCSAKFVFNQSRIPQQSYSIFRILGK